MKRFLIGLIASVLVTTAVYAGWDIVQKPDGSTVWRKEGPTTGGGLVEQPVGRIVLTYPFANLQTSASKYISSPVTGVISQVYLAMDQALGATGFIRLWIEQPTNATYTAMSPTFSINATVNGFMQSLARIASPVASILSMPATSPLVRQGRGIVIESQGPGGIAVNGVFTFVIDQ